jgi:flavodoxin
MSLVKLLLGLLVLAALVAVAVPLAVTVIERRQARDTAALLPHARASTGARVAVVVYSRSGNTALAARHVAQRLDADLFVLEAEDYPLGLGGWASAMDDARGARAAIQPRTLDLSRYHTVWLGAPIWLYHPAPPIRAYVEANRFDGQQVVLFNTYNSRFDPTAIAAFEQAVKQRGAQGFRHLAVRRGRMGDQLAPEAMLAEIDREWFGTPAS